MERSDFSVAGVKTFRGNEGEGFNATIKYKGKKVALVMNDASGGDSEIEWEVSGPNYLRGARTPLEQEIIQFAESLPPIVIEGVTLEYDVELFFEELVCNYLDERDLKKKCRSRVLYKDANGGVYITSFKPPVTPKIRDQVKEWGGVEIINDRFPEKEPAAIK